MKKQINDLLLKMQNGENCIGETANELLNLYNVSGMLPLTENAKKKLEYINGHWTVREFPNIEKVDLQWVGAVLDLLEELELGNYR